MKTKVLFFLISTILKSTMISLLLYIIVIVYQLKYAAESSAGQKDKRQNLHLVLQFQ